MVLISKGDDLQQKTILLTGKVSISRRKRTAKGKQGEANTNKRHWKVLRPTGRTNGWHHGPFEQSNTNSSSSSRRSESKEYLLLELAACCLPWIRLTRLQSSFRHRHLVGCYVVLHTIFHRRKLGRSILRHEISVIIRYCR